MGFRFQKRFRLLPGVTLNLSKSGPSLSVGTHGARVTFGQKGIRRTFGLPECHRREPSELLIRLALAGLVVGNASASDAWLKTIVNLTDGMENETWQHTALLYYRTLALARLSLCDAAQAVLAGLGRRKSERPAELLLAVRYAQADIYEQQGKARQARAIWEKIFAENASDERARRKLGLS